MPGEDDCFAKTDTREIPLKLDCHYLLPNTSTGAFDLEQLTTSSLRIPGRFLQDTTVLPW